VSVPCKKGRITQNLPTSITIYIYLKTPNTKFMASKILILVIQNCFRMGRIHYPYSKLKTSLQAGNNELLLSLLS